MKGSKYYTDGSECKYSAIEQKTGIYKATFYYKFPKCAWGRVMMLNSSRDFLIAYIQRKVNKFEAHRASAGFIGELLQ